MTVGSQQQRSTVEHLIKLYPVGRMRSDGLQLTTAI